MSADLIPQLRAQIADLEAELDRRSGKYGPGAIAEREGRTRPCASCGIDIPWRRWRPRCGPCYRQHRRRPVEPPTYDERSVLRMQQPQCFYCGDPLDDCRRYGKCARAIHEREAEAG